MITLSKIREIVLNQERELENILFEYFNQNANSNINANYDKEIDTKNLLNNIENFVKQNDFEKAKNLLNEYETELSNNIEFYSIKGIINLNEGNLENAYNNFLKGLEIDDSNLDLLYNMTYISVLYNNLENALYYYNKCIQLTDDNELISDLNNLINSLNKDNSYTFIMLDIDDKNNIFDSFDKQSNIFINIVEKEGIEHENKYYDNGITTYEVPNEKYEEILMYAIRRNSNCIVVCSDVRKYKILANIKEDAKIIYYPEKNYYIDNKNSVNENFFIFNEIEMCKVSNFIITDDINIYNHKKIVENMSNIYFIDSKLGEKFTLNYILDNQDDLDYNSIENELRNNIKNIEDEYTKAMYIIASENESIDNLLEISKYIYEKYNTEEIYQIYLSLLNKIKDYDSLIYVTKNSSYCNDIYKAEVIYLISLRNYELVNFIVDVSIKNYKVFNNISETDYEYKIALYSFESNGFEIAYNKYMDILYKELDVRYSPLVNRNISYLMYSGGNDNYKKFYDTYKELVNECLSE